MITAKDVARVAAETGFRSEVVEKALRLHGILDRLDRHEITRGTWLLKGGTALNILHMDVPRLSVDIDVNYVGSQGVEDMRRARPEFERALTACCEREGCAVRRAPSEHAGGKFRLRYPCVLGGWQNLELDVSYVARVPLWGGVRSAVRFPPGSDLQVPTLTIEELAAGKFTALVQRSAVRDAFDAASLLELIPDLLQRPPFRVSFLCFAAAWRTDARDLRPSKEFWNYQLSSFQDCLLFRLLLTWWWVQPVATRLGGFCRGGILAGDAGAASTQNKKGRPGEVALFSLEA